MPVIPAIKWSRWEDHEFEASLVGHQKTLSLKTNGDDGDGRDDSDDDGITFFLKSCFVCLRIFLSHCL